MASGFTDTLAIPPTPGPHRSLNRRNETLGAENCAFASTNLWHQIGLTISLTREFQTSPAPCDSQMMVAALKEGPRRKAAFSAAIWRAKGNCDRP